MSYKPFTYFGGKHFLWKHIKEIIPPHNIFVDVFGGSGTICFLKKPTNINIYNDIDSNLCNFFRVLRDEEKSKKLQELLLNTPYSREEFFYCRDNYNNDNLSDIEKARQLFVTINCSFGGCKRTFKTSRTKQSVQCFYNKINSIDKFREIIKNYIIENLSFEEIIPKYDTSNTLFFLDPPYVLETRYNEVYSYEMTNEQHILLLNILNNIKGKFIICGYLHPIYENFLKKYNTKIVDSLMYVALTKEKRKAKKEFICYNFNPDINIKINFDIDNDDEE